MTKSVHTTSTSPTYTCTYQDYMLNLSTHHPICMYVRTLLDGCICTARYIYYAHTTYTSTYSMYVTLPVLGRTITEVVTDN